MRRAWILLAILGLSVAGCAGDDGAADGESSATTGTPAGAKCGVERWPVKTLSDDRSKDVNFTPQPSSVDSLRNLPDPKPAIKGNEKRFNGTEKQTFTVEAALIQFAREEDEDIHLVIADPSDRTHQMIVEFPDVACSGAIASAHKDEMAVARAAFVAACGEPRTSFHDLIGTATITGVGFLDKKHNQNGLAPNGIELHPVLAFSSSDCHVPGATPTPTQTSTPSATATPSP